jgi:hypothetical protein
MIEDRFGVYRVGNVKFHSKLEAIEMHKNTGYHPHWDFNEAVYSSYDWTVEPNENILELYRQRAQQLRDKYDYIVLWFSGGADSTTVLNSFINNDIKLDELASYVDYSATGEKDGLLNAEIVDVAIPYAKKIIEHRPWMQHRIVDHSQLTVDYFADSKNKFDWIYNKNMFFTPNSGWRTNIGTKIKEWQDIIDSGKKLCLLWGHEKPRLHYENNRWSFRFIDLIDNGPTVDTFAGRDSYDTELFYWSPDLPKIVIKQAHLIKNYLSKPTVENLPFVSTIRSDLAYTVVNGEKYWLSNHGVHSLIYPEWNTATFQLPKTPSIIFSPKDNWFFDLSNNTTAKHVWRSGVEKVFTTIMDYWKNDVGDTSKGLKACWSKDYYLEKEIK